MTSTLASPRAAQRPISETGSAAGSQGASLRRVGRSSTNRNTTRIAIGVTVLVVSILATLTLYSNAGDRRTVIVVRRDVPVGQTIDAADLGEASISVDSSVSIIPASDAGRTVGKVALVPLVQGSLLTSGQIGAAPELAPGEALVGALLKAGQYPTGLQTGSTVLIIEVPGADASGIAEPVKHGVGRVNDVQESSNDGTTVIVSLVVASDTAERVAAAGAGGRLSLVVQSPS